MAKKKRYYTFTVGVPIEHTIEALAESLRRGYGFKSRADLFRASLLHVAANTPPLHIMVPEEEIDIASRCLMAYKNNNKPVMKPGPKAHTHQDPVFRREVAVAKPDPEPAITSEPEATPEIEPEPEPIQEYTPEPEIQPQASQEPEVGLVEEQRPPRAIGVPVHPDYE